CGSPGCCSLAACCWSSGGCSFAGGGSACCGCCSPIGCCWFTTTSMMMMMGCDDHTRPNIWHSSGDGVPREAIKKKKKTSFRNTGAQFCWVAVSGTAYSEAKCSIVTAHNRNVKASEEKAHTESADGPHCGECKRQGSTKV